jgi:GlpG protein
MRGGEIPLTFIAIALIYLGGEAVHSFRADGISHLAHLVGGAAGAAFGFLAAKPRRAQLANPGKLKLPAA